MVRFEAFLDKGRDAPHNHRSLCEVIQRPRSRFAPSRNGPPVNHFSREPRGLHGRRILAVVLMAFAFAGSGNVSRASTTEGSWSESHKAEPHHCKCGQSCGGGSCCCSSGASTSGSATKPSSKPIDPYARQEKGPCIGATPCGGEGLPGPTPGWVAVKLAVLGFPIALNPVLSGSYVTAFSPGFLPASYSTRLDDPPEASVAR